MMLTFFGAGGGSRTHTVLPPQDFKSCASAIPPHQHIFRAFLPMSCPSKNCDPSQKFRSLLEVPPGFEPGNKGFADLCLTAWRWYHFWSGRRDSNPRHLPWQGNALPLSHSRKLLFAKH